MKRTTVSLIMVVALLLAPLPLDAAAHTDAPAHGNTADTGAEYGLLLEGIAAGYSSSADPWVIMDMAAYSGSDVTDGETYTLQPDAPAYGLAQAARGAETEACMVALGGLDLTGPYAIYTVPYVLLAYDGAGADADGLTNTRDKLVAAMTAYMGAAEANGAGADEIAPVLAALARYFCAAEYTPDMGVTEDNYWGAKTAVARGVDWLSHQQNRDGTWSGYGTANANTTALAVIALAALGIDAHSDSRFIKGGNSGVDGLMSFALPTLDGFGYEENSTKNTLSTEQGFRALVAYARFRETGLPYNLYTAAGGTGDTPVAPPRIEKLPSHQTPPAHLPPVESIAVEVSFLVHEAALCGGGATPHTYRTHAPHYMELTPAVTVTAEEGSSVSQALERAVRSAGLTCTADGSGYVSAIGEWEEFDHGPTSGWLFLVDGEAATASADDTPLTADSAVTWIFTDDYSREYGAEGWDDLHHPADAAGGDLAHGEEAALRLPTFSDVTAGSQYEQEVNLCARRGWMTGLGEGTFGPRTPLSRAMAVTALHRMAGSPAVEESGPFTDVAADRWYTTGVAWAAAVGLAQGDGTGFRPTHDITRQELAVLLFRWAKYRGADMTASSLERSDAPAWAVEALDWCQAREVVPGGEEGLFPEGTVYRVQGAAAFYRLSRLINWQT